MNISIAHYTEHMENNKRIAVGMSGGVDSALCCVLLMRAGYEVQGVTCVFVDDEASCAAVTDARKVADFLGIPHVVWECTDSFDSTIVQPFIDGYARGLTPSPCPHCNADCKLPELAAAADSLDCGKIATGHYARIAQMEESGRFVVKRALDDTKDQSYMLSLVGQSLLSRLVTPLGGITKEMVRIEAEEIGLPVAQRPESQDVCFIASGDYRMFLRDHGVKGTPGDIVDTNGNVLGSHTGLQNYTVGQRKGIGIGGAPEPYFVVAKDVKANRLVVAFKQDATIDTVSVSQVVWSIPKPEGQLQCMVKLHYRAQPAAATVFAADDDTLTIELLRPVPATAPGQCVALLVGDTVVAGGTIDSVHITMQGEAI